MEDIKWAEIRKAMFSPEELTAADRMLDLRVLYDGILDLQQDLIKQHHDAEIGCLDYRVIKALAATYELQDFLANQIAAIAAAAGVDPDWYPDLESIPEADGPHEFSQAFFQKMHELCPDIDPVTGEVNRKA